ncbi:hypothetical protein KP509_06G011500 [Ceratopteris richardii]|uniref:Terpene synthase n=1 Tax=Ceratopteris richardii TaxID=49495 RepID=A0A8T2UE83_CERRI|nr:hypothetical protein KP509_06G011500 [Ceratopteris richardii]
MEMLALRNLHDVPSLIVGHSVFSAEGLSDTKTTFQGTEGSQKGESRNSASGDILATTINLASPLPDANGMVHTQRPGRYSSEDVTCFAAEVVQGALRNQQLGSLLGLQTASGAVLGSISESVLGTTKKERKRLIPITDLEDARIPHLSSSFASELHPCYEAVRKECEQWILDITRPSSAQAQSFLLDCQLPRLVCHCLPGVAEHALPRLVQTAKMISWLLIADDEDDDPRKMGSDYMATSNRAHSVMAILYGSKSISEPWHDSQAAENSATLKAERRVLDAFRQLWAEIQPSMSLTLRARFVSSMAAYLDSLKIQAAFRRANYIPDVHFYMDIRRQTSFMYPAFVLGEYVIGDDLERSLYRDPLLANLENLTVDFANLCNDVVSCRQEANEGDYFNLPSILYIKQEKSFSPLTFQDAINITTSITGDLDNRITLLQEHLENAYSSHSGMHTYIKVLLNSMSGCLTWFLESGRYNTTLSRNSTLQ